MDGHRETLARGTGAPAFRIQALLPPLPCPGVFLRSSSAQTARERYCYATWCKGARRRTATLPDRDRHHYDHARRGACEDAAHEAGVYARLLSLALPRP